MVSDTELNHRPQPPIDSPYALDGQQIGVERQEHYIFPELCTLGFTRRGNRYQNTSNGGTGLSTDRAQPHNREADRA